MFLSRATLLSRFLFPFRQLNRLFVNLTLPVSGPSLSQPIASPMSSPSLDCPSGSELTFELITGFVYSSPADTVTMLPGVLHLSECLEHCRDNFTCRSLNFETGLCVLLSSSAMQRPFALTPSQFPVFTIYAHKICLKGKWSHCLSFLRMFLSSQLLARAEFGEKDFLVCLPTI